MIVIVYRLVTLRSLSDIFSVVISVYIYTYILFFFSAQFSLSFTFLQFIFCLEVTVNVGDNVSSFCLLTSFTVRR